MNRSKKIIVGLVAAATLLTTAGSCEPNSNAQTKGQELTEQAFEQQSQAVPYPVDELKTSLERENLRKKLLRQNKADAPGYVYLFLTGSDKPIGYYSIKGKVSSTQSQMTATELVVRRYDNSDGQVVTAPGDDGSYGDNESGIFFFTTEDVLVTSSLDYIWSDEVLPIDVKRLG